jgi:hypothetical protein
MEPLPMPEPKIEAWLNLDQVLAELRARGVHMDLLALAHWLDAAGVRWIKQPQPLLGHAHVAIESAIESPTSTDVEVGLRSMLYSRVDVLAALAAFPAPVEEPARLAAPTVPAAPGKPRLIDRVATKLKEYFPEGRTETDSHDAILKRLDADKVFASPATLKNALKKAGLT